MGRVSPSGAQPNGLLGGLGHSNIEPISPMGRVDERLAQPENPRAPKNPMG
jgi:hypothetical protein